MREIVYVEKHTVTQDGKTTLEERRCHGLLGEDGSFRLLACCGKRFPLPTASQSPAKKKEAA